MDNTIIKRVMWETLEPVARKYSKRQDFIDGLLGRFIDTFHSNGYMFLQKEFPITVCINLQTGTFMYSSIVAFRSNTDFTVIKTGAIREKRQRSSLNVYNIDFDNVIKRGKETKEEFEKWYRENFYGRNAQEDFTGFLENVFIDSYAVREEERFNAKILILKIAYIRDSEPDFNYLFYCGYFSYKFIIFPCGKPLDYTSYSSQEWYVSDTFKSEAGVEFVKTILTKYYNREITPEEFVDEFNFHKLMKVSS